MKIVGITRDNHGYDTLPPTFTVGQPPVDNMELVSKISFYETGCDKGTVFRGPCYVVQYENSNVRTVIPAVDTVEVTAVSETKKEQKVDEKIMPAAEEME